MKIKSEKKCSMTGSEYCIGIMTEIQVLYKHLEEFHLEELIDCSYYYGQLDEDNATSLLEDENFGTYLIRDGPLTVAVPEIWNTLEIQKMVEKNARTVLKFQSLF